MSSECVVNNSIVINMFCKHTSFLSFPPPPRTPFPGLCSTRNLFCVPPPPFFPSLPSSFFLNPSQGFFWLQHSFTHVSQIRIQTIFLHQETSCIYDVSQTQTQTIFPHQETSCIYVATI